MSALFTEPRERFAVLLDPAVHEALRIFAAAAHPLETGGALIGYYDSDKLAVVTGALGPPGGTVHGRHTLELGAEGLTEHFAEIWPDRYYLGDWHTHPGESPPVASATDHATMIAMAARPAAKCPQPLSIILGGTPGAYAITATIYENGVPITLNNASSGAAMEAA